MNEKYVFNNYGSKNISVSVKFKAIENDVFQLFYRDSVQKFNEKLSENISIRGSSDFQWITYSIPDSLSLMQLRFDFGNSRRTSPVQIDQFKFAGNSGSFVVNKDSLLKHFRKNGYVTVEPNGVFKRKMIGKRSDPFLISYDLRDIVEKLHEPKKEQAVLLNVLLSLVLSLCLIIAIKVAEWPEKHAFTFEKTFVMTFLLLIFLPLLDSIFELDNTVIEEKRALSEKPEFRFSEIEEYPKNYEDYLNDHFGFRNKMISYGGILKAKVFGTSPRQEKVIVGKENMMFYWIGPSRNSYFNDKPFVSDTLGYFGEMLRKASNMAKLNKAHFYISIYPDKHSVYKDFFPLRYGLKTIPEQDRERQLEGFLLEEKINYVPQKQDLLDYRSEVNMPIYHNLDSHWNTVGAFRAYQNLIGSIRGKLPEITQPLDLNNFDIIRNDEYSEGDLMNIMGVDNSLGFFKDTKFDLNPKTGNVAKFDTNTDASGAMIISNPTQNSKPSLLIFGDSFTFELLRFLPYHFSKTIFVRGIEIDMDMIEAYQPDVVLYGIVERNLESF